MENKEVARNDVKKRNPFLSLLKGILVFFLVLLLIVVVWCSFSALHRKSSLSLLPSDYSVYVHTDSIWEALSPIIDLEAIDIALASPGLGQIRGALVSFRQAQLKDNKLVSLLASRPVDIGVYMSGGEEVSPHIVAILDLGFLSSVSRISKFVLPFFDIKDFSIIKENGSYHYEFASGENVFYLKPFYNTVIFSTSKELLDKAIEGNNDASYTKDELALVNKKIKDPIKIIADAKGLISTFTAGTPTIEKIAGLLSQKTKALVSVSIKEKQIGLNADVPLENLTGINIDPSLVEVNNLLSKNSTMPQLLSHFSNLVQYYTVVNAGTFQELTQAVFPLLPADVKIDSLWKTASTLCKTFFSVTLDDLLFSWTGKECAAFGLEGLNAPVFVLQVSNEEKRREVFDNVLSSIILHDDTSLILNGIRLPKIKLPRFLQSLLEAFKINLPNPYYLVHNGYVYFSESPEVLSTIYNASLGGIRISENSNWKSVSEGKNLETAFSLFYDLERSEPFFVRGNNLLAQILELYTVGRCDVRVNNSVLSMSLNVSSNPPTKIRGIPGFPVDLQGKAGQLQIEAGAKANHIFWVEDNKKIKVMDTSSTIVAELEMPSSVSIIAADNSSEKEGVLWAITEEGVIYNLLEDLTVVEGFPIMLESKPTAKPSTSKDSLIIPLENKLIISVNTKGKKSLIPFENITGSVLGSPTVLNDKITIYEKGFLGKIQLFDKELKEPKSLLGIAYGSPALLEKEGIVYTAFVTQAGSLYIWNEAAVENTPIILSLFGVFYTNVVSSGNYFYALAADGTLHRISVEGETLSVQIPNATAKEGVITVASLKSSNEKNIYIGIDGNLIYGFNENLELLPGFPITGKEKPVFADANGDGNLDCFVLTMDNKLNAWNMR